MSGEAIAPGWYDDPMRQHESRYWDGSMWTDHVANQGVTQLSALAGTAQPASSVAVPAAAPAPTKSAASRANTRAVLILVAGGLMVIGALLPWEEVTANGATIESVKGLSEGAGGLTLGAGFVVGLLAALFLNKTVGRRVAIATLVVSAIDLVFVSGNVSAISDDIDKAKGSGVNGIFNVDASLGIGISLALIGCLMAVVASILLLRVKDAPAAS